eukprot:COSAG01_NODE_1680_length_9508_cov_4.530768_7_plen_65_part_00
MPAEWPSISEFFHSSSEYRCCWLLLLRKSWLWRLSEAKSQPISCDKRTRTTVLYSYTSTVRLYV